MKQDEGTVQRNHLLLGSLFVFLILSLVLLVLVVTGDDPHENALIEAYDSIDTGAVPQAVVPKTELREKRGEVAPKQRRDPSLSRPSPTIERTTGVADKKKPEEEKKELLVEQKGSVRVQVHLNERQRRFFKRLGEHLEFKVRLRPLTGLDPAFQVRRAVTDPKECLASFEGVPAVSWLVTIAGLTAGIVRVEPGKTSYFHFGAGSGRKRIRSRTILVVDDAEKPVPGASIYWMSTNKYEPVHEEVLVGKTDVHGLLKVFDSTRGVFLVKHGNMAPQLCGRGTVRSHTTVSYGGYQLLGRIPDQDFVQLKGTVLSAKTGRPVKGAYVEAFAGGQVFDARACWQKDMRGYRRLLDRGDSGIYPTKNGIGTHTLSGGHFRLSGLGNGPHVVVVRHPQFASPEPRRLNLRFGEEADLIFELKEGATAKGRVKGSLPDGMGPLVVGGQNQGIFRQQVARDGSFVSRGHPRWQYVLGVPRGAFSNQFVELKHIVVPETTRESRVDFDLSP